MTPSESIPPAPPGPEARGARSWDTHSVLLDKLARFDEASAWGLVDATFRAPLGALATRAGLDGGAAQDAVQDILVTFAAGLRAGRYDRTKGRLSAWLFGIARVEIANALRRQARRAEGDKRCTDDASLSEVVDDEFEQRWNEEWERHLLRRCLARVQLEVEPATYGIFVAAVLSGESAQAVARRHGVPITVVYNTKSRVAKRLHELRSELEDE